MAAVVEWLAWYRSSPSSVETKVSSDLVEPSLFPVLGNEENAEASVDPPLGKGGPVPDSCVGHKGVDSVSLEKASGFEESGAEINEEHEPVVEAASGRHKANEVFDDLPHLDFAEVSENVRGKVPYGLRESGVKLVASREILGVFGMPPGNVSRFGKLQVGVSDFPHKPASQWVDDVALGSAGDGPMAAALEGKGNERQVFDRSTQ
ncbi:hypothetical protein U1Q18_027077 [Sarracenia purpurea var. burkii]